MKIVVISPHPDDETIGAGGTLIRMKKEGHSIYWINVTDIDADGLWDNEFVLKRKEQIKTVIDKVGFNDFFNLKVQPCSLENIDSNLIISKIKECIDVIKPEWVIIPNPTDAHTDHRAVYEAVMSCTKIFRYPFVKRIMTMEILSETDFSRDGLSFSPNYYVNITDYMDEKINVLKVYDTELGEVPFPRSIENIKALAMVRGGTAGVVYAEAFRIVKWIE